MLKNQRHTQILEILKRDGFAEVRYLGQVLYASQPTIRRDLDLLEKSGYIKRSHGGAMLSDNKTNAPISFRRGSNTKEKSQICRLAAKLIKNGDLIFTDASTTASHLAEYIQKKDNLTVVTNGYTICGLLSEKDVRVFSTGGRLIKSSMAFVGAQAEDTIRRYNADILFFSSSSLDEYGNISDYSEEETALRIAMKNGAKTSVFLCDSSKFNRSSAFKEFSLSEIDYVITDQPLSASIVKDNALTLIESNEAYMYKK